MALSRLLGRHPEFMVHVAAIMSFDLWAMHDLRGAFDKVMKDCSGPLKSFDIPTWNIPKLMLLTVAHPPIDHYELWVDVNDYGPIDGWLKTEETELDGVYVRYEPEMMEPDGAAALKALCKKYTVGVWGKAMEDPDDFETMHYLVKECGVTYFNTDLPREFLSKAAEAVP